MTGTSSGQTSDPLHETLRKASVRIADHLYRIPEDDDPKLVHETRVSARRIRTVLDVFAPALEDTERSRALAKRAKVIATRLGPLRDADVLLRRIRHHLERTDVPAAAVIERLQRERKRARKRVLPHIKKARAAGWSDLPAVDTSMDLVPLALEPWHRLVAIMESLGLDARPEDLHRARVATKRARYAAEVVSSQLGDGGPAFVDAAAAQQRILGDINDGVLLWRRLRDEAPEISPKGAFAAGAIAQLEASALDEMLRGWPMVWAQVVRSAPTEPSNA